MKAKKIFLITGGSGMVGTHLANALIQRGDATRILSRQAPVQPIAGAAYFQGDVAVYEDVERAMQNCVGVFHCAAEKYDQQAMQRTNVQGTRVVCETARKCEVDSFCHLSSVGAIGYVAAHRIDEMTPCNPVDVYQRSKLEAEKIVERTVPGKRTIILRPTRIFDRTEMENFLFPSLLQKLKIWIKGRERHHMVYVEDVVAAMVFVLDDTTTEFQKFIVSSDEEHPYTYSELYELAQNLQNKKTLSVLPSPPTFALSLYRKLRYGKNQNKNTSFYSSQLLQEKGFSAPFGIRQWLEKSFHEARSQ